MKSEYFSVQQNLSHPTNIFEQISVHGGHISVGLPRVRHSGHRSSRLYRHMSRRISRRHRRIRHRRCLGHVIVDQMVVAAEELGGILNDTQEPPRCSQARPTVDVLLVVVGIALPQCFCCLNVCR